MGKYLQFGWRRYIRIFFITAKRGLRLTGTLLEVRIYFAWEYIHSVPMPTLTALLSVLSDKSDEEVRAFVIKQLCKARSRWDSVLYSNTIDPVTKPFAT